MIDFVLYSIDIVALASAVGLSYYYHYKFRNITLFISYSIFSLSMLCSVYLMLGKPIPQNMLVSAIYDVQEAKVLYFYFDEGKAIYLLISAPGEPTPLYLKLPWSTKTAQKLQTLGKAGEKGEPGSKGTGITVKKPFAGGLETRPNAFEHKAPPMAPTIPKPRPNSQIFNIPN